MFSILKFYKTNYLIKFIIDNLFINHFLNTTAIL